MRRRSQTVWFVTFPCAELLDVAGPSAVLGYTNTTLGYEAYDFKLITPLGGDIATRHGLALTGARSLTQATRLGLPDTLIVSGGSFLDPPPAPESKLVAWLRLHQRGIPRVVSICAGAFLLGAAGLLDHHRCTTHWKLLPDLRSRYPLAHVVDDGIYLHDRRLWTSAGITAGIDLTLALVEHDHGHDVAMAVARHLVLFLRRSGHQRQFSEALKRQGEEPPRLRDLTSFVLEHLDEALPVERLAQELGMTTRTFARFCRSELEESPAALIRRLRLEEARRLLTDTDLPLKAVAARTGLGDPSTLWRVFTKELGVTPAEYRERFVVGF